jgi:hypothetical protein
MSAELVLEDLLGLKALKEVSEIIWLMASLQSCSGQIRLTHWLKKLVSHVEQLRVANLERLFGSLQVILSDRQTL